jgi:hypothetical protein
MTRQHLASDRAFPGAVGIGFLIFLRVLRIALRSRIIDDILRDRESGGWSKAGWIFSVLSTRFLGVLTYLVARRQRMAGLEIQQAMTAGSGLRAPPGEICGYHDSLRRIPAHR